MSESNTRVAPWEDFTLRLIAIYKLLHGMFFTGVGFGLLKLRHHDVVEFLNVHLIIPYHLDPEGRVVDWLLAKAAMVNPHMLVLLGWGSFFYAALFFAEGVGLYMRKHWAEYLVVIVTGSLLPIELYELFVKLAWWKFAVVLGNLAIVSYLIHRLRLDYRNRQLQVANTSSSGESSDKGEELSTSPAQVAEAKKITSEVP